MQWILVASFLLLRECCLTTARELRLTGKDADIRNFAYQASIRDSRNWDLHICGGFFYRSNVVITAAHCVFDRPFQSLQVYGGSADRFHGGNVSFVNWAFIHPEFNRNYRYNDIAVLVLTTPFILSTTLVTAEVAGPREIAASGQNALVSGWGQSNAISPLTRKLQYSNYTTISDASCNQLFAMTNNVICARNNERSPGMCKGDTGDPLAIDVKVRGNNIRIRKVLGIASTLLKGSCDNGDPVAFTRISKYQEWINQLLPRSGIKHSLNSGIRNMFA